MTVYINGTTGYSGPVGTIGDLTTTGNTTLGDASGDTLTINGSTTTLTQGTANGVAYLNGSKALTTGTALVFDGTNLGVGVTPSAWGSSNKAVELGTYASFAYRASNGLTVVGNNLYINGSDQFIYKTTNPATLYQMGGTGEHYWYNAPSGTAGTTASFTRTMTLASTGYLGINETSPDVALTITRDNVAAKGQIKINASDYGQITFYKSDKTTQVASIYSQTSLTAGGLNINTPSGGGPIIFATNGVDRWRIATGGDLQAATTNAGISFSKSGALANSSLNDYEVGTWTPVVQSGSVVLGTINVATYVKVGRVVTVNTYCDVTTSGDSNNFVLGGLPFTVQSNGYSPNIVDIGTYGVTGAYARADGNTNQVAFLYPGASAGVSRQAVPGSKVAGYVIFTLTYHTSS